MAASELRKPKEEDRTEPGHGELQGHECGSQEQEKRYREALDEQVHNARSSGSLEVVNVIGATDQETVAEAKFRQNGKAHAMLNFSSRASVCILAFARLLRSNRTATSFLLRPRLRNCHSC